ncbi:MAG: TonB-dependent receptor [Pseudomonadota bacterium]
MTPSFSVIGAYTAISGETTDHPNPDIIGQDINFLPDHQLNVFGTYEIQSGKLQGLGFGTGLFYRSDVQWFPEINIEDADGYTTLHLTAYYKHAASGINVRVYVDNVTDEVYLSSPTLNYAEFGPERSVRLILSKQF